MYLYSVFIELIAEGVPQFKVGCSMLSVRCSVFYDVEGSD